MSARRADGDIAVLAGGVGAARMLRGIIAAVPDRRVTAIVNVADDEVVNGLHVSPDLDTVMYTVAGANDDERGWGLQSETWQAMESLRRYTDANDRNDLSWFSLGDRDLGTHLYRTSRLAEGASLSVVTAEMAAAWDLPIRLLPVSDDTFVTRISTVDTELAFQEYFVREHHEVVATAVRFAGADTAEPGPGVLDCLRDSDVVVIAPSNPIVSVGPLLAVPGVRDAVIARRSHTVAVSPIVGGAAIKGPAARLLEELGHESSALGVARIYRDVAAWMVIDEVDADLQPQIEDLGMGCVVAPTVMVDVDAARALAQVVLEAAQ